MIELYDKIYDRFVDLKTGITRYLNEIKRNITDTDSVSIIINNETRDVTYRYYLVRLLDYIEKIIDSIKKRLDIESTHIQIKKNYKQDRATFIIDSSQDKYQRNVNLTDIINHVEEYKNLEEKKFVMPPIFTKFSINKSSGESFCLKNFLINYKDTNEINSNTLENILKFNRIYIDENDEDSHIEIVIFQKSGKKQLIIPYKEVKDYHLNYFYQL